MISILKPLLKPLHKPREERKVRCREHEFEEFTQEWRCDVCGTVVELKIERICQRCYYIETEYKVKRESIDIATRYRYTSYGYEPTYRILCRSCYEELQKLISELMDGVQVHDFSIETGDVTTIECDTLEIFKKLRDTYIENEYIASKVHEEIEPEQGYMKYRYAVMYLVKPLQKPIKLRIKLDNLIDELKRRKTIQTNIETNQQKRSFRKREGI